MSKSVLKALLFGWCCLVLILCGCSTHLHAQACVGNSCWVPVDPRPRTDKPVLNVVVPRKASGDYDRFVYRIRTDEQFRRTVCPTQRLFLDQLPEYAQKLVLERGTPYFYYSDSTDAYTVGFGEPADFLIRIKQMRPEARKAAAEQLARDKQERAEDERRRRDQEAAEAEELRRLEEEEGRLRREEVDRLEQERREREEIEKADESPDPPAPSPSKPPTKKPTIRDELRQGAKIAGKQAFKWALPRLLAAAGFSTDFITVAGITVASGGTAVGMYGAALAIAAGVRWLRKKKQSMQNQ